MSALGSLGSLGSMIALRSLGSLGSLAPLAPLAPLGALSALSSLSSLGSLGSHVYAHSFFFPLDSLPCFPSSATASTDRCGRWQRFGRQRPSTRYGSRFRRVPPLDFKWMRFGPIFRVMTSQHALLFLQTFTGNFPDTRRQPLPRRKRARAASCRLDLGALRR